MDKRQTYALAGFLVGTGAPGGALFLQYVFTRPWGSPLAFADAQWAVHPFFYWYMLLSTCLVLSALGYWLGRLEEKEARRRRWDQFRSHLDPVTGVLGPVQFEVLTHSSWDSFPWRGFSLSALAIEVDGFSALEEKYGHAFGAGILQDVAWLMHFTLREDDLVGREGPAFLCLLPRCDAEEALTVVRRLQSSLRRQTFRRGDEPVHVTVGAGVATLESPDGASLESLFAAARRGLKGAKAGGPHRVQLVSGAAADGQ